MVEENLRLTDYFNNQKRAKMKKIRRKNRLKSFEPQYENVVTYQNCSDITILHLEDIQLLFDN